VGEKRKMIHIPQALESTAQQWIETYQEAWGLMEKISQTCLERFAKPRNDRGGKAHDAKVLFYIDKVFDFR